MPADSVKSVSRVRDTKKLKKAAEARAKRDARIKKMLSDYASPDLRTEAEAFVERDPLMGRVIKTASNARSLIDLAVHATKKATEKESVEAIARVYAMWILSSFSRRYDHIAIQALDKRKRPNPKTTKLHLLVEAMISHAEKNSRANSQLCNRDVQAIRWLNSQKVPPNEVPSLFREPDEGLDIWSRKWADSQRERKVSDVPAAASQNKGAKEVVSSTVASEIVADPHVPLQALASIQSDEASTVADAIKKTDCVEHQPDFEITWRDNTTKNCTTFRFMRPSPKIMDDLAAFRLLLKLLQNTWGADSLQVNGGAK